MGFSRLRRLIGLSLLAVASALVVTVSAATRADAHALLTSSQPAAGTTLVHSPTQIMITFGEQPDPKLSTIKVLDTSGRTRAGGHPQPVAGEPATMSISVPNLPNGVYTVTWQTVSKVDGHLASGAYAFGIGASPAGAALPKAAVARSPRPSALAIGSRWLFFAGILALFGMAFVELVVAPFAPPASAPPAWAAAVSWVLLAVGVMGITEAQRRAAHVGLGHLLSTSLGHSLAQRGIPTLATGLAVLALLVVPRRRRRSALLAVAAGAALVMLADVDTGHAAASHSWEWFRLATQWLHFAAAAVWIGGLGVLVLILRRLGPDDRHRAARRFSMAAAAGLGVVVITGVLRAYDEVGSWHRLASTGFGQTVVVKAGLLLVLAVLGAFNRFRSVPAVSATAGRLRRIGSAELGVAAVVLVATAVLQNLAPARSVAAPSAPAVLHPIVIDAHDFATTVRLQLTVSPGTPGFDQFHLQVLNYDTGQPIPAARVTLTFHYPWRTDVGDSTLDLVRTPDGAYTADGANLPLPGRWAVTVLIQGSAQSTEVPLDLVTQSGYLPTDIQRNSGLPTVYTVHFAGGRQLQVYLDPGRPGFNEFHATFFTATGTELGISNFAVTDAVEPAGSANLLTTRKLDDLGHYVADAPTSRGTYRFSVAATTTDRTAIGADIEIPVK